MQIIERRFATGAQVLYNQLNTEQLHQVYDGLFENIASIGCGPRILRGSFLAAEQKLVGRAQTISTYKGDGRLFVNNPYPFMVGDILRVIGPSYADTFPEYRSISLGTAPTLGTITKVVGDLVQQKIIVTFTSTVKGNIAVLWINGILISTIVQSPSVAALGRIFAQEISEKKGALSILNDLVITPTDTGLELTHREPGEIFTVYSSVEKGLGETTGQASVEVAQGVGEIQFTPAANAPATLPIGSKVGRINDVPLGVINWDYITVTGCCEGSQQFNSLSAYNKAMVYRHALPYLDGHLVQAIPGLSYMPAYGESSPGDFFRKPG
jgi:hypothetical protein